MRSKEKEKMLGLLRDNKTLTKKERQYARLMIRGENMLFVKGATSLAKSAIAKTISEKLNLHYIQLATPTKEPSDFGVLPMPDSSGEFLRTFKPYFAKFCTKEFLESEKKNGTLIVFEEINRCGQDVLNACLNIFAERRVEDFVFADDVLFYATGNVGIDDGTKVKQLEKAQTRRMFLKEHTLSNEEWLEGYGHNLNPLLYEYFEKHSEKSYPKTEVKGEFVNQTNYANWSKFNSAFKDHLYMMGLEESDPASMLKNLMDFCMEQINEHECNVTQQSTQELLEYLESKVMLTINDLVAGKYFKKRLNVKREDKVTFFSECLDWFYENKNAVFAKADYTSSIKNPFEYLSDFMDNNFDKSDADGIYSKIFANNRIFESGAYFHLLQKYMPIYQSKYLSLKAKSSWDNAVDKDKFYEYILMVLESYQSSRVNKRAEIAKLKVGDGYDAVKYLRFILQIQSDVYSDIQNKTNNEKEKDVLEKIKTAHKIFINKLEEIKNE